MNLPPYDKESRGPVPVGVVEAFETMYGLLPDHLGMTLIVVPYGDDGRDVKCSYLSTFDRKDAIKGLKKIIENLEKMDG